MYGSDINKILNGLYAGGTALAGGLIDKADRKKAKDTYDKESEYLKNTWANSMESANNILTPPPDGNMAGNLPDNSHTDINGDLTNEVTAPTGTVENPGNNVSPVQPITPQQPNMNDLYARREKGILDLQGMKYGAPYAESLNRLYKNTLDPEVKNKWEIREGEKGEFFAINKETFEVKNITAPKPKEKEFSTKNWQVYVDDNGKPYLGERTAKGIEYRDELNKAELDDWNYKQKMKDKSLAPPVRSRTGPRTGPKVKSQPLNISDGLLLSKAKEYYDLSQSERTDYKDEKQYDKLKEEIENMTGQDADVVSDRIVHSNSGTDAIQSVQELNDQEAGIMSELENIMNQFKSGEYDKQSLADSAYEWLGSLFSENIDPSILDKAYEIFDKFVSQQFGGEVMPWDMTTVPQKTNSNKEAAP